jgi:hypothetical protein
MKIQITQDKVDVELWLSLAAKDRSSKLTISVVFVVPIKEYWMANKQIAHIIKINWSGEKR